MLNIRSIKTLLVTCLAFGLNAQVIVMRHKVSVCNTTIQTYTSAGSTTWTVPSGCTSATFEVYGAGGKGGAGGTDNASAGGGAGGGAYGKATFTVSGGDSYTVTVGSAGLAGSVVKATIGGTIKVSVPNAGDGNDGDGAGTAGTGGPGASATIGSGGTSTVTRPGGNGGAGHFGSGGGGGGAATSSTNGTNGADSSFGNASGGTFGGGCGDFGGGCGPTGQNPGGGGAGVGDNTLGHQAGGTGKVIITPA